MRITFDKIKTQDGYLERTFNDGVLLAEVPYTCIEFRHGTAKTFHSNGFIRSLTEYDRDVQRGQVKYYDINGLEQTK